MDFCQNHFRFRLTVFKQASFVFDVVLFSFCRFSGFCRFRRFPGPYSFTVPKQAKGMTFLGLGTTSNSKIRKFPSISSDYIHWSITPRNSQLMSPSSGKRTV